MRARLLCFIISLLTANAVFAQEAAYGFKLGANYSQISNLSTMILSEPYFINYDIKDKGRVGWALGIFYDYKLDNELIGFESELSFAKQGGNVEFSNYEKDFHYKMEFAYQYVNIVGLAKWFPGKGKFSVGAGPFWGINVFSRNIKYKSWGDGKEEAFGEDLDQEQQLRNVLRGRNNFGMAVDAAYKISDVVKIGGRFYWSGTNAVETQSNAYNFKPVKNTNTVFQLSVALNFESMFD